MNPVLNQLLTTRTVTLPDGRRLPLDSNIESLEGEILAAWIAARQPTRILEIGLAYGVSALFICDAIQALPGVNYYVVDPYQSSKWHGSGVRHLAEAGYEGVFTFVEEPSETCLPAMMNKGCSFDFAFIDGQHTFDHALIDFFYVNRMLEIGGAVIFDDAHLPSIQKLAAHIATYPCYTPLALPLGFENHRTIRLRRMLAAPLTRLIGFEKIADDERSWNWHCDF